MKKISKEIFGNFLNKNVKKSYNYKFKGHKFNKGEINLFKKYLPWGVILFKRNIKNFKSTKKTNFIN